MADPFALNEDGTARDPAAFRAAIKADPVKMEALEKEPEVAAVVLGEDDNAFQELIKSIFQVIGRRLVASREPPGPRPQQKVTGHLTGHTSTRVPLAAARVHAPAAAHRGRPPC